MSEAAVKFRHNRPDRGRKLRGKLCLITEPGKRVAEAQSRASCRRNRHHVRLAYVREATARVMVIRNRHILGDGDT